MLQKWCNNFHTTCPNNFWTLKKCPWRFVTLDYTTKRAKIFFSLESLPFFSKTCFQQPLRFFKIWSFYFHSETQIFSWTLTKCFLRFVILENSIMGEKKGQNLFFSLERLPFLKNLCFQKTSWVLQKWSFDFHSVCQNTLWTLIKCSLRFVILDNTRKRPKLFFTGKIAFFSKICFQQPLRFFKIWSNYFRSETQITSWTLTKCSLRFAYSKTRLYEKKRPKSFFH